eukprot:6172365-Pleurochrysis_carterae.AAC.1
MRTHTHAPTGAYAHSAHASKRAFANTPERACKYTQVHPQAQARSQVQNPPTKLHGLSQALVLVQPHAQVHKRERAQSQALSHTARACARSEPHTPV